MTKRRDSIIIILEDYEPGTGRYLESDPIGLLGSFNTYGYVDNSTINSIDPSGLVKLYGSWCGPNWTGGFRRSWDQMDDVMRSVVLPPIDHLDACCAVHDITYAKCRSSYPCDSKLRKQCFINADRNLGNCAANSGGNQSPMILTLGNPQDAIEDYMSTSNPDSEDDAEDCGCKN